MHLTKFLILIPLVIVTLLAACQVASPSQPTTPSLPPSPSATSTLTVPPLPTPTSTPSPSPQPSPTPIFQFYVDPDGRYQVALPSDWRPGDQPGTYAGPGGYFRAVNLPEMAFYSRAYQVCMHMVQTLSEPAAVLLSDFDKIDSCKIVQILTDHPLWARAVIKAPNMLPEKRYFYIETDAEHSAAILDSLQVLFSTSYDDFLAYPSGPLRPADQVFWNTPRQPAPGLTLTETRLAAPASDSPAKNDQFPGYVPRELWLASWGPSPAATPDPLNTANQALAHFGFELRQTSTAKPEQYDLYQAGKRIREQVVLWDTPILSSSGQDFALPINTLNGHEILRRGGLEQWGKLGRPEAPYRFLGESLLAPFWNSNTSSIEVRKDNQVIYRFATLFGADFGLQSFQVWQNHWLMEVRAFLIQDGAILNDTLGFEEIYDWQLFNVSFVQSVSKVL
jgi:hypothetical protein